ncbi:MAG: Fic family protein [Chloroflexota bacterium]
MSRLVTLRWEADPTAYGGRRARAAFTYQAFIPDPIGDRAIDLPGPVALAVSRAEAAIQALNTGPTTGGLEALAPLLLRAESVASSRIEGLELSQRNLARALFDPTEAKGTARAVAGNVRAMEAAIALGTGDAPIGLADILDIHRILLDGVDDAIAGRLRTEQNWIGGRWSSPLDAEFVPPPPDEVEPLLTDLVAFLAREDLPAIAQAAIAHAQFETIHPFADGNGRVGRALIQVVLRRRGLAPRFVPPVSVVLATNRAAYVAGLTTFRDGQAADWCGSFALACGAAAEESARLGERIATLQAEWVERAGRPRRGSAAERIIAVLPSQPILSVATARAALGGSGESMRLALNDLAAAGVVRQITAGRYARAWAADDLFDLLNAYERGLATPTRTSQERRASPRP